MWSKSTVIYQLVDRTHLDCVTGCNREKKNPESNCRWRTETNSPEGRWGILMSTFHSLQYRTRVLNKPFPSQLAFLRGSRANGSLTKCNETMILPQDEENCPLFLYNLDEVNEKKQIPLCNLPNYESTAKVQFWLESSVVKNTNKSIWWGVFFSSLWVPPFHSLWISSIIFSWLKFL